MKIMLFCALSLLFLLGEAISENKSAAQNTPVKSDKVLAVQLEGSELYKSIVEQVSSRIDQESRKRESDRWTFIAITIPVLFAIIAFFGLRSISDIRRRLADEILEMIQNSERTKYLIEDSVKRNITTDVERKLGSVSEELSFIRLTNIAESISDGSRTGFKPAEKESIVATLDQIKGNIGIVGRPEFSLTLEKIIDVFAAADLDDRVDSIINSLRAVTLQSNGICQTLIQHYGMRLLGDVSVAEETIRNFNDIANACKIHKIYEMVLPFQIVHEHSKKDQGYAERINGYLKDVETLNDDDRKTFFQIMDKYTDPKQVAKRPTGQVLRVCEKVNLFMADYGESINKFRTA